MHPILNIFLLCISCFFLSCNTKYTKHNAIGQPNEVLIIASDSIWKTNQALELQSLLQQPKTGLPQPEPFYKVIHLSPSNFNFHFKKYSTIIFLTQADTTKIEYKYNVWAKQQLVVNLKINYNKGESLKHEYPNVFQHLQQSEINKLKQNNISNQDTKSTSLILLKHKQKLYLPVDFSLILDTTSLIWFRKETTEASQQIVLFQLQTNTKNPLQQLIYSIDSVCEKNIKGSLPNSYLVIDKTTTIFHTIEKKDTTIIEFRGLWKMEHDFMGGPFIGKSILISSQKKNYINLGFLYAPSLPKRNLIMQLESILLYN